MDYPHDERTDDSAMAPWQFSLRTLLLAPVGVAIAMGILVTWYPYSAMSIPALGLGAVVVGVWKAIRRKPLGVTAAVVIMLLVYFGATLLLSGVVDLREPARLSYCKINLKQIALALQNYHDAHGCLPPAYIADALGRPMHSWRVLILPYLDGDRATTFRNQYRFDEPWNGPNNSKLAGLAPPEYVCPEQEDAGGMTQTSYVALIGPDAAWPGATSARFRDLRKGLPNTVLLAEVADSGIHWMEPRDLDVAALPMAVNPKDGLGISSHHRDPGWRRTRLGAHVAMADGSVQFLRTDTPTAEAQTLIAPTGPANPVVPATQEHQAK